MLATRLTAALTTLLVLALTAGSTARTRLTRTQEKASDDTGLGTLEIVVISLGLFLLAGIVVAAIFNAVNTRTAQIR